MTVAGFAENSSAARNRLHINRLNDKRVQATLPAVGTRASVFQSQRIDNFISVRQLHRQGHGVVCGYLPDCFHV